MERRTRLYAENRLRSLRKARQMSQEDIALAMDPPSTKATIAKLETRMMAFSADYMIAIAKVLGVRPGALVDAEDQPITWAARVDWTRATEGADAGEGAGLPVLAELGDAALFTVAPPPREVDKLTVVDPSLVIDPKDRELREGSTYLIERDARTVAVARFTSAPPRLTPCGTETESRPVEIGREPFLVFGRVVQVVAAA